MPYAVSNRPNTETGKTEYIVVSSDGIMAPPPHGGPFSSKAAADESCAALIKKLSIEEWLAAHIGSKIADLVAVGGKILHIAPDGRWIQNRGGNTFAVYPPTDLELVIGEMVSVDKSGEIELLDRNPGHGMSR